MTQPFHTWLLPRVLPCMQFERTLIIAEDDAYVSYLEGCTAPAYDSNQLHAAVVELSCGANAEIKYSTVQNW
jgi:Fe-S cluster assembly scaffold protein SufB